MQIVKTHPKCLEGNLFELSYVNMDGLSKHNFRSYKVLYHVCIPRMSDQSASYLASGKSSLEIISKVKKNMVFETLEQPNPVIASEEFPFSVNGDRFCLIEPLLSTISISFMRCRNRRGSNISSRIRLQRTELM